MSLYYITKTRKPSNAKSAQEIEGYYTCPSKIVENTTRVLTDSGKYYSKSDFFITNDFTPKDQFKTWNGKLSADITIENSSNGELFLKSKPNNTTADNLLELPDC